MALKFETLKKGFVAQELGANNLFLAGFVDVRSGYLSINGEIFPKCSDCSGSPKDAISIECTQCGRNKRNNFQIRAGAGDGVYPVFEIKQDGLVIGTITFLEPSGKLIEELFDGVNELLRTKENPESLSAVGWQWLLDQADDLQCSFIGDIDLCADVVREALRQHRDEPFLHSLFFSNAVDETGIAKSIVSSTTDGASEQRVMIAYRFDDRETDVAVPSLVFTFDHATCASWGLDADAESLDADVVAARWANSTARNRIGRTAGLDIEANKTYFLAMVVADPSFWDEDTWIDEAIEWRSWHVVKDAFDGDLTSPSFYPNDAPWLAQLCTIRGNLELSAEFYDFDTKRPGPRFEKLSEWPEWLAEQQK